MNLSREEFENLKSLPLYKGRVISDSMEPVIMTGENIVVDVGQKEIKRFDIVVVFIDGKLVCHYLWRMNRIIKPVLLQTRNMSGKLDYPVKEEDYLGKVLSHKLGFWRKLKILL